MEQLLKEFFYSDVCEVNHLRIPSKDKAAAEKRQDTVLRKLKQHISDEDYKLFEDYIEATSDVIGEEQYLAFICGIKLTLQIFAEIFCGEL